MPKLTYDDLVKLRERVRRNKWSLMFINPENKTFNPIQRESRSEFHKKVKKR